MIFKPLLYMYNIFKDIFKLNLYNDIKININR